MGSTISNKKTPQHCLGSLAGIIFLFLEVRPKNKKAEPMSQYLAWGQYFCFFLFFLVFRGFCNILVSDMGSAILFCLCFSRFWQFSGI